MKKIGLKIIGIILIVTCIAFQGSFAFAASAKENQLNNKKQSNDKQINEAKENLEEVQAEKSETVKQVEDLSTKIADYESQIDTLDKQISELTTKIDESQKKLDKAKEDYERQQKLLDARLVATYEAGDTGYLDFILSSKSITDLISNYYLVTEVAQNDTELLEKIHKQKEEVEEAKKALESNKQELATSKASKQSVTAQLQTVKKEKNQHVEELTQDEKDIQAHIEELRTASSQIEKELKAEQERYAAQIEALKKAEANKPSNSGGSNNNSNSGGGNFTGGGNGTLARPVSSGTITATMYYPSGSYHGALDYGVPVGTPVYAADTGVVLKTANLSGSYGTYVVIQHANLQTWYAHGTNGSICVTPGQTVSRGQQIMKSGNTGNSSGPHLHFEVRVSPFGYGNRVDPRSYL